MASKIIRLCYRKIIDSASQGVWETYVFDDSYKEFLMQAQFYNAEKKYNTFAQLLQNVKGAEKLHFLVSAAVTGYVQQLAGVVPDVTNALGKTFLPFSNFRFEIINSDIKDKGRHRVALNFYSDELRWLHTVGTQLIINMEGKEERGALLTETVALQPFLSIYSIKEAGL